MEKVVVAMDGNGIASHFGQSMRFLLAYVDHHEMKGKEIIRGQQVDGTLVEYLSKRGADVVIAGSMGGCSQKGLKEHGIKVIVGAKGHVEDVIVDYLNGSLVSTGEVCQRHLYDQEHECRCGHNEDNE